MKIASLFLISILSCGCTAKKMVVKNADVLVEYQIKKRLPLYSAQKEKLSKDVKAFLNDQKALTKKSLPIISQIELDPQKVDVQYDTLQGLYKDLALHFSKLMGRYMALLDSKQQKEFKLNLDGENRQLRRFDSNDLIEKTEEQVEFLFGAITDEQIKLIKDHGPYLAARHKVRLSRRKMLHENFSKIYKMDLSKESRETYFDEAFNEYQNNYPENPKNKELIKKLLTTLNMEQKEVFKKKVKELKEIINYYLEIHY